jgi:outer membrane protein OmpA-like peptidoglycan-associated protein
MLDNNDDAKVEYNNHVVDKQIELQKASIPNEVYVYQDINNKSMHAGKFVFNNAKQNPDIIYIGAWPYLSTVVWNAYLSNQIFGDVAMLLKWKETRLLPFETKLSSFYYGLKNNGTVNAITSSNKIKESKFSIYFKTGSHHLTKVHQQRINEELAKVNNVSGVVVSGYTDAKGNTDYNYGLSLKRVKSVTNYIVTKGIASGNIIPKAFGESYANFELNDKRIRRCDIVIYSMED